MTRTSLAFRLSTSLVAAVAILIATAAMPQMASPALLQWAAALAAAGFVFFLSEALLAFTIVALPAAIFFGRMYGMFA
ncbi:hypothetical protein [Massilia sp. HP4]|uniref:hypothetical protein n=1 Tax=Massilia sp. HP4 TaxID=2562316 RepID=UPI0010BFF92F|nr:hypothetical protein [Massilia sp. HP4]